MRGVFLVVVLHFQALPDRGEPLITFSCFSAFLAGFSFGAGVGWSTFYRISGLFIRTGYRDLIHTVLVELDPNVRSWSEHLE